MVEGKYLNFILIIAILLTTLFIIGAGCEQETQTNGQQQSNGQQLPPQAVMLFSDDFSQCSKGSSPDQWDSIMEDKLQANIEGTSEKSGKYGNVVNVKGRILTTGSDTSWKNYVISLDFKINVAGENTGPEIAFYVSDDSKDYYIVSSDVGATAMEYYLYRVEDSKRYQLKKRAYYDLNIEDGEWHALELNINEGKLDIDDITVFEFETDGKLSRGGIGLATNPYGSVYFDNIAVVGIK